MLRCIVAPYFTDVLHPLAFWFIKFVDSTAYVYNVMIFSGLTVTILSSPAGTPVSGSTNTFNYPILSSVTLTCNVTADDQLPVTVTSYRWNTAGCYTHPFHNNGNPTCFPDGQTTQNVTDNDVTAEDAGTITCTVTISGSDYTSGPFTLRISGEQIVYCVIACIVYCKQCMLLLLATCYCSIIHQLLYIEVYLL